MRTTITIGGGELEAVLLGNETWRVSLGELEESSPYLDYALARLLDVETHEVHKLATRIIEQLLVETATARPFRYTIELVDGTQHTYAHPTREVIEREVIDLAGRSVVAENVIPPRGAKPGLIRARPLHSSRPPSRGRLGRR
jgi:hypothetical protein